MNDIDLTRDRIFHDRPTEENYLFPWSVYPTPPPELFDFCIPKILYVDFDPNQEMIEKECARCGEVIHVWDFFNLCSECCGDVIGSSILIPWER